MVILKVFIGILINKMLSVETNGRYGIQILFLFWGMSWIEMPV
jgi:hypothetical protein